MMKVKSPYAFFVTTERTLVAFVFNHHYFQLSSPFSNGALQILGTIGISSFIWHIQLSIPNGRTISTASRSTAELPGNIKFSILRRGLVEGIALYDTKNNNKSKRHLVS